MQRARGEGRTRRRGCRAGMMWLSVMGSSVLGHRAAAAGRVRRKRARDAGRRVQGEGPCVGGGGGAECLWDFLKRQDLLLRGSSYSFRLCHLLHSQLPAKHHPESPSPPPPQLMAATPPSWNLPLQFSPRPQVRRGVPS